jgi:nicotinamide mononucleotide adenylyltransferase
MSERRNEELVKQKLASVHGRFQPFHKGHLEYFLEAFDRYEFVLIGITQFVRRRLVGVAPESAAHRAFPASNPLTYFERTELIRAALEEAGVESFRYRVTPFPIEEPVELLEFIPLGVPALTTTYDAWNRTKIELLQAQGYEVVNLWTREVKEYSGQDLRSKLLAGDEKWRQLVPDSVAVLLDAWGVAARIQHLSPPADSQDGH